MAGRGGGGPLPRAPRDSGHERRHGTQERRAALAHGHRIGVPEKSLMRMFGPTGNPRAENLVAAVAALKEECRLSLTVRVVPLRRRQTRIMPGAARRPAHTGNPAPDAPKSIAGTKPLAPHGARAGRTVTPALPDAFSASPSSALTG
jgi:hypothetical protein